MTVTRQAAVRFIVALGFVSLFSDFCYEGGRSITGPFLAQLGASAAVVGFVAGFGEFAGYTLRLLSGFAADKSRAYWPLVIFGTIVNLGAVPLLALAGRWEVAALLIVAERAGKAIRTPARDVMLSQAASATGRGWGFGVHETMDQTGAFIGPLVVATVLRFNGRYESAFAVLAIPFGLALSSLLVARSMFRDPSVFEPQRTPVVSKGYTQAFWFYSIAGGCIAMGYVDFPLIAYHFNQTAIVKPAMTPVFYAAATGVNAVMVLIFGRSFDRLGVPVLIVSVLLAMAATPLVFLGSFYFALLGMAFWGAGLGSHQSLIRATIAGLSPSEKRGAAFGIFNTVYGLFWFAGSTMAGLLYARHTSVMIVFSITAQLAAIPLLLLAGRKRV